MAPPQCSEVDSQLITDLHKLSKNAPKLVKSSIYPAPADPSIEVRSWKMNEFKYYDIPSPFPTLARGIFTVELPKENEADEPKYRIVARGYDKFFNIGEVPWTTVCRFMTVCLLSDITFFTVAFTGSTHSSSVYSISQIEWLHHLLRRAHPVQALDHLETLDRSCKRLASQPRRGR